MKSFRHMHCFRSADMTPRTSSLRSPAFFGRMPLLLSEQERCEALVDTLRELRAALDAGSDSLPARLDPRSVVEELSQVLAEHFLSAEDCLRAVAQHRPDLLPAVVDMRSDHSALSESLADLRLLAWDQARWVELPGRIGPLIERLTLHREAEAGLVHEAARAAYVA